ncbi:interleukin-25-like isoform X1 [Branchiostoma floridae x Branchiostoma belcheri]
MEYLLLLKIFALLVLVLIDCIYGKTNCTLKEPRERSLLKQLKLNNLRNFNKILPFKMGRELAATQTPKYPDDVNLRAAAPWNLVLDHDENRFPKDIAVANCTYKHCYDHKNNREDANGESIPYYGTVPVLEKKKLRKGQKCPKDGKRTYSYKRKLKTIAVACICVRPQVSSEG